MIKKPVSLWERNSFMRTVSVLYFGTSLVHQLSSTMQIIIQSILATSTNHNYHSAFNAYISFCHSQNLLALPLQEFNLVLFVTNLSLHTSYSNIKLHISAVKHFNIYYGYHHIIPPLPRLYMLTRAIKRQHGKNFFRPQCIPVTPQLLLKIKHCLFSTTFSTLQWPLMLWAAITCAFFCFLRSSEFVAPYIRRYKQSTTLLYSDVSLVNNLFHINIKASKTDPFWQGGIIWLAPTNNVICPFTAMTQFLPHHPLKSGPLFSYNDGSFLTRRWLSTLLKQVIPSQDQSQISTHSFRIGAATTAAAAGLPKWLIQQLGRWNSDCFRTYLRIPHTMLHHVASSLATMKSVPSTWDPDLSM